MTAAEHAELIMMTHEAYRLDNENEKLRQALSACGVEIDENEEHKMSEQPKHTSGPWLSIIHAETGYARFYMPACGLDGDVMRGYVGEADARLITASPDMLAALEDAKRFIENGIQFDYINIPECDDSACETLDTINKAIAAAKGE